MFCKNCGEEITKTNIYVKDSRYCLRCGVKHSEYLNDRRVTLKSLREMNLESKIIQTKYLIKEAIQEFGIDKVYISYSGGKDSTVLSHIAKSLYPDILHIFANTTNEYPETLSHIKWEQEQNGTNLISVIPRDSTGAVWNFKKVVENYGYPMFSKRISNAIRTYQHALSERTTANSLDYMERNFKKYLKYKELPISDKCCDKLKKEPLRRKAKELGLQCAILGILASESYQREKDWLENGCNVFYERKDNHSRPLSFWTDEDISDFIKKYSVKIPELYNMGYSRNGCMFCGFGVHLEAPDNNRYQRLKKTHPIQYHYFAKNFGKLMIEFNISIA
ncbi:MAG: phosphoadenosine phosphosulfate reductase family protein [Eubacteriales bacterium]